MIFLAGDVNIPILGDVVIILAISVVVILLLHRMRLPSIIGFLMCGILFGPKGVDFHDPILWATQLLGPASLEWALYLQEAIPPHLINTEEEVKMLAEIGVVLLMFTIGLEFSIASLMRIRKAVFLGGGVQVLATIALFGLAGYYLVPLPYANLGAFFGFFFALSSTAIVLKLLQTKGEINARHGQVVLAVLLFQDIAVVPMILLCPIMAGIGGDLGTEIGLLVVKVAGIVAGIYVLAKYAIPWLLYRIALTKSKDLFIVTIVVLCFVIAFVTDLAGLSLALGAFLAGLAISESKYGLEAASNILPFKEIFTSLFFVSVGMLLDLQFLFEGTNLLWVLLFTFLTMFGKGLVGGLAAILLKESPKSVILVALSVCQVGEFAFVLLTVGEDVGLVQVGATKDYMLAVAVLSMAITPVLLNFQDRISYVLLYRLPMPEALRRKLHGTPTRTVVYNMDDVEIEEHIIILGFGLTGRTIAHGAKSSGLPYVIVELDPRVVETEAENGEPIIYGDPTHEEVLEHAQIDIASAVVITSTSVEEAAHQAQKIREMNEEVFIVARTPSVKDADEIRRHGADVVISDEVEANMEVLMQVLDYLEMPATDIYKFASYIRKMANEEEQREEVG